MTNTTFPCPACGGPLEPLPGADRIPCSYCSSQVTIPERLRLRAAPKPRPVPPPAQTFSPEPEIDISDALRKVQPVAANAVNAFWVWSWARRFLPGCLAFLALSTCICLATIVILISNRGG